MISIRTKLLPVIVVGTILLGGVFYIFSVNTQQANVSRVTVDGLTRSKNTFENLQQDDVKMFQLGINNVLANTSAMLLYQNGDRDNLIQSLAATFEKSKALGQSVFQFNKYDPADPNKLTVFARVHNPAKSGDAVTRTGNRVARDSKGWGYGIDLGNSGFALRVVYPILDASQTVVGDVEFGEDLNRFLSAMKSQTGNDYVMVVDKTKVTADGWKAYTASKGKPNNYADLPNLLAIDSTLPDYKTIQAQCLQDANIASATPAGNIFAKFQSGGQSLVCGGFYFNDINGQKVGTIVVVQDITALEATANQNNLIALTIAILLAVVAGAAMMVLVSRMVVQPLDQIVNASLSVIGGDFEVKIVAPANDEIGQLAQTIELLKEAYVSAATDLEKAQEKVLA